MRKFIGIFVLACFAFTASAQSGYTYEGCANVPQQVGKKKFTAATYGKSTGDLNAFFSVKMEPILYNQKPTGTMDLQIVVGMDGRPCLTSCKMNGKVNIEPNHIKQIVDGMGVWNPASQAGRKVDSNVRLLLSFDVDKVAVKTVGGKKLTR